MNPISLEIFKLVLVLCCSTADTSLVLLNWMAALVIFEVCEFAEEEQCLQTQYLVCGFWKEGGCFTANLV